MREEYFRWLISLLESDNTPPTDIYGSLLRELHNREFFYIINGDSNRAADGIALRGKFEREYLGRPYDWDDRPCSVLEMLVGLSMRVEEDIMQGEPGSSIAYWFWSMIDNLGLIQYVDMNFDRDAVRDILYRFMYRKYNRFGIGSIFYSMNPRKDYRKTELWYQVNWYLSEHYI